MDTQEQGELPRAPTPLILVVEDDDDTRTIYSDYLTHHGYRTLPAAKGEEALALAKAHSPDVALVDVRLPRMSGQEVAAWLREHQPEMKIIFVTVVASLDVAVEEMRRGAFYYLTKPVKLQQLLVTVEEACRTNTRVRVGNLVVDLREGQATLEGKPVPLTALEGKLLTCLACHRGRVTSYDELWQEVWGYDSLPDKRVIHKALSRLREKIGRDRLVCIRRRGYMLQ